jgi:hypothetical protein
VFGEINNHTPSAPLSRNSVNQEWCVSVYNVSGKNCSNSMTTIPFLPSSLIMLNSFVQRPVLLNFRWNIFECRVKVCEKKFSTETAWQRLACPVSDSLLSVTENSAKFGVPSGKVEFGAQNEQWIIMCNVTCTLFYISAAARNIVPCIQQLHISKITIRSWAQNIKTTCCDAAKGT